MAGHSQRQRQRLRPKAGATKVGTPNTGTRADAAESDRKGTAASRCDLREFQVQTHRQQLLGRAPGGGTPSSHPLFLLLIKRGREKKKKEFVGVACAKLPSGLLGVRLR